MGQFKYDYTGQYFGLWFVLGRNRNKPSHWDCICTCGNQSTIIGYDLKRGHSSGCKSCRSALRTHGMSYSKEYCSWSCMIQRCYGNSNIETISNYKNRGIYVCDYYLDSFENFYKDIGNRPEPKYKYSIDRIDSNESYTCGKCSQCIEKDAEFNICWSTKKEQTDNRYNVIPYMYEGKILNIADLSKLSGIPYTTLRTSLLKKNLPLNEALTCKIKYKK